MRTYFKNPIKSINVAKWLLEEIVWEIDGIWLEDKVIAHIFPINNLFSYEDTEKMYIQRARGKWNK